MKYFTLQTVKDAYKANSANTKNKFWGLLSILSSIDDTIVEPGISYDFDTTKVSEFLENLFCLEDIKKSYSGSSTWNIMLSSKWTTKVSEQMLSTTPNIYDIIAWYFRATAFDDTINDTELVKLFLEHTHISIENAKILFDFTHKDLRYSASIYAEKDLHNQLGISGKNITAEGNSVVAHPGELSRAPFIQTLYAGQGTLECLIITPFRFSDMYGGGKPQKSKNTNKLQKIYFGTPGSGKSHTVANLIRSHEEHTFRVTFHPDSDYASFVGSYKPITTINNAFHDGLMTIDELAVILKDKYDNGANANASVMQFGIEYSNYFNGKIASYSKKDVVDKAIPGTTYDKELQKAVNLAPWIQNKFKSGSISYQYVPQTFTNAYVDAWLNDSEPIYLVIEEINRGNCAQIFGDLFQLLDRNQAGLSEYPIIADNDLRQYLESVLGKDHEGIKNGKLRLPSNFHILATMNTSDQSLFPMDSAFKRRWDWEYVPINAECPDSQFKITIADKTYKWPSFLTEVNKRIHKLSDSEDKQMGNFFIKNDVDVEEFKSKVMFYLWSEVCKEYENSGSFFKDANNGDAEFTFNSLFPTNNETNSRLQGFMKYLNIETE